MGVRARHAVAFFSLALAACGGGTPAPQAPAPSVEQATPAASAAGVPASASVETGKDCAHATGKCGGGTCNVTIKNDCDQPVHCDLQVSATCESQNGTDSANGGDRTTIAAHETADLGAQATCSGPIVHTEVEKLVCR